MSYRMTKIVLQHMIYMKEAKTKFNIKRGENGGKRKKEKGSVIIDIHQQCV